MAEVPPSDSKAKPRNPGTRSSPSDRGDRSRGDRVPPIVHRELRSVAAGAARMEDVRRHTVRLRLGDAALVDDLLFFFRRRDSRAELVEDSVVEVAILHALDERQARLELDLYLRVWEALHPDARVEVLRAD